MKNVVVFDIDGCITDPTHRLHLWENPDAYDEFVALGAQDPEIEQGIWVYRQFLRDNRFTCLFITSRNEDQRQITEQRLFSIFGLDITGAQLLMRPAGHTTLCRDYKYQALIAEGYTPDQVFIAFDDLESVIDMWREHGIVAYQTKRRLI